MKISHWVSSRGWKPSQAPQVWRWWQLFSLCLVEGKCYDGSHYFWRLWCYTRWRSGHVDYFDDFSWWWQHTLDSNAEFRRIVFEEKLIRPKP